MEMNWSYIAGFFDGEGCLHAIGGGGAGMGTARITIAQSLDVGRRTLEEIAAFLNERCIAAHVYAHKHSKKKIVDHPHWRQVWNLWITDNRSVRRFIEGVFPYLRIKKSRAEDYRRFCMLYPPRRGLTNQETQGKIRRDVFFRLMEQGKTLTEIAQMYEMDYSSLWIKAKRFGFKIDSTEESNRKRAKISFDAIVGLLKEYGDYHIVARRLNMPSSNLRTRLVKNGIDPGPLDPKGRGKRKSHDISSILPPM
jgi:LAGLIDADG-like domain